VIVQVFDPGPFQALNRDCIHSQPLGTTRTAAREAAFRAVATVQTGDTEEEDLAPAARAPGGRGHRVIPSPGGRHLPRLGEPLSRQAVDANLRVKSVPTGSAAPA
jgi:hypothetical protein